MKLKTIFAIASLLTAVMASAKTTPSESLRVWFDDFSITADGKSVAYMKVYENDLLDYTAFNMTCYIPAGLKINQVKSGRETVDDIFLSERAASTHGISCAIWEDGTTLRVISTSTKNDNFYPDDEDGNPMDLLYTIGFVADPDMQGGVYDIEMTGIKFVLSNGDACVPADDHVYGTVTVNVLDGVDDVTVDEISAGMIDGTCYDLSGLPVQNPSAGMIVIYKDRKVRIR